MTCTCISYYKAVVFNQKILAWQCRDIFCCHNWRKKGLLLASKHPTTPRTSLTTKNYPVQNVISAKLEKPCYKVILGNKLGNFDVIGK